MVQDVSIFKIVLSIEHRIDWMAVNGVILLIPIAGKNNPVHLVAILFHQLHISAWRQHYALDFGCWMGIAS